MNERTKRRFYRDYPILIPYQIDFNTTTVGRHIRQTKRHVTWRFGFTHIPSVLLDNKTGVACRGLELEIHLVWSVASGKQVLYLNNVLLHQTFPASSSSHAMKVVPSQRFEHSMYVPEEIVPGGHVIHITAWALGFGSHGSPDNQFSMTLDGQNYRDFYPMYKLGSPEMRNKYSVALEKAREKLSRLGREHDQDQEEGEERNPTRERWERMATTSASTTMDSTTSRPFMSFNVKEDRYWEKPTVPLPSKAGTTASAWDNASAPDLLPPDIRPEDVARNDREEETLLAQARLESFRDLKRQQEQRARMASDAASKHLYAADQRQEEQFLAQARIRSFRDIRGSSGTAGGVSGGDDASMAMSIPSFARPPPVHRSSYPAARYHPAHPSSSHYLKPVKEGAVDLLDVDDQHHQESQEGLLRRSESSVTLDTAIQSPDDDLMSLTTSGMSDVYSHLDPRQNWRTQQNVSFRLQKPPVYADTLAGDLIQPSASFSNDVPHAAHESSVAPNYSTGSGKPVGSSSGMGGSSNSNVWQQAATFAGRNMDYYKRHATTTMPSSIPTMGQGAGFVAAPPPTWESIQEAYAVPSVPPSSNSSSNPYPSSWQQPIHRQHP